MRLFSHIDKIVHDDSTEIPQPKLPSNFFCCGHIEVECILFCILVAASEVTAIDVDGNQCFRLIDNDRAATLERYDTLVNAIDLLFQLISVEQRLSSVVHFNSVSNSRHHELYKLFCSFVGFGMIDDDRIDIFGKRIANRSNEDIALFVHIARSRCRLDAFDYHLPQSKQIGHIARKLIACSLGASRTNDEPDTLWQTQVEHHRAKLATQVIVFDFATDTYATQCRHQDQVATWNANVG